MFIDGTYFNTNCLLVASTTDHVVAWHWCFTEDSYAYSKLLNKLAPPKVVTTDGQKGALKAIKNRWPTTRIQRCLVHVKRNIQTYVTLHPQTSAGKALRRLSLELLRITTTDQATEWLINLQKFHTVFHDWLNEKTYLTDVTDKTLIPTSKHHNKKWWYTHDRTRSAYTLLERLARNQQLFVYLTPPDGITKLKATTNSLEGGVNAGIKKLLYDHRGLPEGHQRVICDWWLYLHTDLPDETPKRSPGSNTGDRPDSPKHKPSSPKNMKPPTATLMADQPPTTPQSTPHPTTLSAYAKDGQAEARHTYFPLTPTRRKDTHFSP